MTGPMKHIIRVAVWTALSLAAVYALLAHTVGVSFYRSVPLDNDPLTNSIAVTSVSSGRLMLADGRVLGMLGFEPAELSQYVADAGGRVELESSDERLVCVFVKRKIFYCGTHSPRVVIPLIRKEYPVYYRQPLGMGEFQ